MTETTIGYSRIGDNAETLLDCVEPKLKPYSSGVMRAMEQFIVRNHDLENARGLLEEKLAECDPAWQEHLRLNR